MLCEIQEVKIPLEIQKLIEISTEPRVITEDLLKYSKHFWVYDEELKVLQPF